MNRSLKVKLLMCDGESGYNYGAYLEKQLAAGDAASRIPGLTAIEVLMVKIWNSGCPKETEKGLVGCDGSNSSLTIRSVIQNDDADQQNPGSSSRAAVCRSTALSRSSFSRTLTTRKATTTIFRSEWC